MIDTHCHLDLYPNYLDVLAEIERKGVYTIAVTNTPSVFRRCSDIVSGAHFVRVALGLHPELATDRESELDLLAELLPTTRYVGEVGLDFVRRDSATRATQRRVFNVILERCAASGDKVLTVHSRRAAVDVVAMIGHDFPGTVILHWFSGPSSALDRAVTHGYYFSVNSAMLASEAGRRSVSVLPRSRVLTETDGPFTAAHGRPARPGDISDVIAGLAQLWNLDSTRTADQVYNNFKVALTRIPAPGY